VRGNGDGHSADGEWGPELIDTSIDGHDFTIRLATVADAEVLARHRCEMFRDMGQLGDESYNDLARASAEYFSVAMPKGEYMAWLVAPASQPDLIVAGGGLQLRQILPRPDRNGTLQKPGPQGLIVNVYTEKAWRRRGLGELVTRTIIEWCRQNGVASVVLHASAMGRALYERIGFIQSNEMYYPMEE
jgi:GNAT superfamily N-acetyltransferase